MRRTRTLRTQQRCYHVFHPTENVEKVTELINLCKWNNLADAIQLLNTTNIRNLPTKAVAYASVLQTSTYLNSFTLGQQLHAHILKCRLEADRFVGNNLLALYFKLSPNFTDSNTVFNALVYKDVVCWTSMMSGYIKSGKPDQSIGIFFDMVKKGVHPNGFTLSSVIKACAEVGDLRLGKCFHGVVVRNGFQSNCVISSALIDMYGRNCVVRDARRLFDELVVPDKICWTSVISSSTRNDMFTEALGLFYLMMRGEFGLCPDEFTLGTVLTALGNLGRLRQGKEVHGMVLTSGLCGNVVVESSLVDMYGKCRSVGDARRVFDRMGRKNSVSWSALLGVYCQNGEHKTVVEIFREMEKGDLYSFGTVLRSCAGLAAVRHGKEVHCQYVRRGGWRDVIVESALVDLYAKCGCIDFAYRLFLQMSVRNLITWNSMICGFAQNGRGGEALRIFDEMIKEGIKPDYISFVGVLFACSHAGLVDQGQKYFNLMSANYGIKAGTEHYNCMVDLLGRAGLIEEAENLLQNSDCKDDSSIWAVLLGACTTCTEPATAERIAKKMMELEPGYHLSYVLLANIYRAVGRWDDALEIRRLMEEKGVKKTPGKSWIEGNRDLGSYFDRGAMSMQA